MKQMMVAAASVAMAIALTGCGGSPKGVAEDFMDAIIQREADKALKYFDTNGLSSQAIKAKKEMFDRNGKEIDDNKLEAEAIREEIVVPPEIGGYKLINGAKITGENAEVLVQFKKGKDWQSKGAEVDLLKIDGSWKVKNFSLKDNLDTSDK